MTDEDIRSVLAQMARAGGAASETGVVTPARALRLSLTRAVEGAAGLKVTVLAVAEVPGVLDDAVAAIGAEDLVLGLNGAGGLVGVAVLDKELRSAFVEAQTMGRLSSMPAPDRPVSVADAALATPVVDAFLVELAMAAGPTVLDGWTADISTGGRLDGARGAALKLTEASYRIATMTIDLGVADREGRLVVALPMLPAAALDVPQKADWSAEMEKAVLASSAPLTAVLHRLDLALDRAGALRVGDVLSLGGASLGALRLEAEGGLLAGHAHLGQLHGMKAVRVGPPAPPEMLEAAVVPRAAALEAPAAAAPAGAQGPGPGDQAVAPASPGPAQGYGAEATAPASAPPQGPSPAPAQVADPARPPPAGQPGAVPQPGPAAAAPQPAAAPPAQAHQAAPPQPAAAPGAQGHPVPPAQPAGQPPAAHHPQAHRPAAQPAVAPEPPARPAQPQPALHAPQGHHGQGDAPPR